METTQQNADRRRNKNMQTGLIILAVLLLLALLFMVVFMIRDSRTNKEKELLETDRLTLLDDYERLHTEKSESDLHATNLEQQLNELQINTDEQLQAKDNQIAALRRLGRETDELQKELEAYKEMEIDFEKVKGQYAQLLIEYENLDLKHNNLVKEHALLADSINQSRGLQVYNIRPMTHWERWLWADRYHVERARRVDQTHLNFEVAGNLFTKEGSHTVYLVMLDPEGSVVSPAPELFVDNQSGQEKPYTEKQDIDYQGDNMQMQFAITHPDGLNPGTFTFQVYIDGDLVRTSQLQLE